MATPNKGLETPATGSNNNVWGSAVLNPNFTKIDTALGGTQNVTITGSNVTLSASEALNLRYVLTGTLTGNRQLIWPAVGGVYVVQNDTAGAFTVTLITTAAGDSVVIPQGATLTVSTDGTDMVVADGAIATGQMSYAVDTGAADAYVVAPPLAVALKAGVTVRMKAANPNTGASTLNASGTGATAIVDADGDALAAGAIVADGVYTFTFDGTSWQLQGADALPTGGGTITGSLTVDGVAIFNGGVQLVDDDAGAAAGPRLDLIRDSATPAASDEIGEIRFVGEDSGSNAQVYGRLFGSIVDPTSTSEDGRVNIETVVAGTNATRGYVQNGLVMGAATGGDQGAGTTNVVASYINGAAQPSVVAQCAFDGTTGALIGSALNVTSVTRGAAGNYTVNFTSAIASADVRYALACMSGGNSTTLVFAATITTTTFGIGCVGQNSGSATVFVVDSPHISLTVWL